MPNEEDQGPCLQQNEDEARYRLLVQECPCCIHEVDLDGRLLSMNSAGLRMLGAETESEIIGSEYFDLICHSDRPRIEDLFQKAKSGLISHFEFEGAGGRTYSSCFVPEYQDGNVFRLMGITLDITEQTQSHRARLVSERRLALAVEGASLGFWDYDLSRDGVTMVRPGTEQLGSETITFRQYLERIHPQDRESFERQFNDHLTGAAAEISSEHRLKFGENWRWLKVRGRVVQSDKLGNPLLAAGTALDVTERRHAREKNAELERQLHQAQKMESIGQLAGGIAHDFNNLLLVMMGHLDLAFLELGSNSAASDDLRQVQASAEKAANLVKQLLAFSRQEPCQSVSVNPNDIVASVEMLLRRLLPTNIALSVLTQSDVPPIKVDPAQIEQALLNLCVNARDAMKDGGSLEISTRLVVSPQGDRAVEIQVNDTGTGMKEETARRAFEPFFTTKVATGGSGLGLAMVHGTVYKNGGVVSLDSSWGKGTRISLVFPATDEKPSEDTKKSLGAITHKGTILVVEDEPKVRSLVTRVLADSGHKVLTAEDGEKGVAIFQRQRADIDLVLLDVVMPNLDGKKACEQILSMAPETRILFTSGYHPEEVLCEKLLASTQPNILEKPYLPAELLRRVDQLLSQP